jgi:hypothetical protein
MLTDLRIAEPERAALVVCGDVGGRPRTVSVTPLVGERVMVVVPPGEVAELEPARADELGDCVLRAVGPAHVPVDSARAVSQFGAPLRALPCRDGIGRARGLRVAADCGLVIVTAPPGGVIVFGRSDAALFRAALRDAVEALGITAVIP